MGGIEPPRCRRGYRDHRAQLPTPDQRGYPGLPGIRKLIGNGESGAGVMVMVVDENVGFALANPLRQASNQLIATAEAAERGIIDGKVLCSPMPPS